LDISNRHTSFQQIKTTVKFLEIRLSVKQFSKTIVGFVAFDNNDNNNNNNNNNKQLAKI